MSEDPRRRMTLAKFLNEPLEEIIADCPDGAAGFKAILTHVTDHMKDKGYKRVSFTPIDCNAEGYCQGWINYG